MATPIDPEQHRVAPGRRVKLDELPTREDGGLDKGHTKKVSVPALHERMAELHDRLYAEGTRSLLVVLQAMDAAGKDSTIRRCFGPLNPQRCETAAFRRPSEEELAHDFLWRVHRELPERGRIQVFNRSHYEDVLAVRVRELAAEATWKRRYEHINAFEKMLADEGTAVLKLFLHVSPEYQRERFERRIQRPDKRWKFAPADLDARERWADYRRAYEDALTRCSTDHAPWYVVPGERRWYRDAVICQAVVDRLEALDPQFPSPDFDPDALLRRLGGERS
jgi:PPK2 family polyphosphate:nucleotide phosphotransferase